MGTNIPGPVLGLSIFLAAAVIVMVSLALRCLYLAMREEADDVSRGTKYTERS
jgi:hypothetical protein